MLDDNILKYSLGTTMGKRLCATAGAYLYSRRNGKTTHVPGQARGLIKSH